MFANATPHFVSIPTAVSHISVDVDHKWLRISFRVHARTPHTHAAAANVFAFDRHLCTLGSLRHAVAPRRHSRGPRDVRACRPTPRPLTQALKLCARVGFVLWTCLYKWIYNSRITTTLHAVTESKYSNCACACDSFRVDG